MVQVDLPAAFAVGQICAMLSKKYLKKESRKFTNRLLGPMNIFLSCCFAPVGMFLMIAWPSWEVMYWTGWVEAPFNRPYVAGFYILFGIAMVVIGNVGFILAHHWYRNSNDRRVVFGAVIGVFFTLLPFLLWPGTWLKVGTYEVVTGGGGDSFFSIPFFPAWFVIISYISISITAMVIWLIKWGNKLEP